MSEIPNTLKYTRSHEWVRLEDDGSVTVGITDHAQTLLGDLVFVDLPDVGQEVFANEDCAVVESVKAASDVYSPLDGEVIAINSDLVDHPELVNSSPYDKGWLFQIRPENATVLDELLDPEDYEALLAEED
ncbi:glycine cleavage system protein GcvH [Thioflexithrix psekupsensis]|uniref:Glycine cleavage system H protein n=1 Tax=Thioflexithrix psekupsensis TaxID=1570016 RepID=A0A251XBZ2_9GAMM|nr:glycine cleavage system protein GcvH [Thioflexithrix psekupsensis]OUD16174.1 glycine cleavage system protein H [Thioflexithrix psekupsensis]